MSAVLAFVVSLGLLNVGSFAYAANANNDVKVPNVTGYQLQQATNVLEANGFHWQIAEGCSNYVGATVTGTDPWGGETVPYGSTVYLYTEEQETVIDEMYLGYYVSTEQSDGTYKHELVQFPNAEQAPWIEQRLGTVQLAPSVKWRGQSFILASDTQSGIATGDLIWGSSDTSIATVDQNGLVTAAGHNDGEVVITCTLVNDNYTPSNAQKRISAQILVHVIGQAGAYPVGLAIVDAYNVPIGADGIIMKATDGTVDYQPYVRVAYSDGTYKCNAPECDPAIYTSEIPGLSWKGGNAQIAYVNSITGTISPIKDAKGSTDVTAYVVGGRDGTVQDTVYLTIEGLTAAQPASQLLVKVVYDEDRDTDVSSKVYTPDTFVKASKTGTYARAAYTQYGSSEWVTIAAEGVYLDELLADVGVHDLSEVYTISTKTTDGKSAGQIAAAYYFDRNGYYYPNYWNVNASGVHNTSGGVKVQPMVAVRAYQKDGKDGDSSTAEPDFTKLNGDRTFWILEGANGGLPQSRESSTYYTYEIDVVLKGAPKTNFGDGGENGPDGDQGGGDDIGTGPGTNPDASGEGNTGTDDDGTGQGGSGDKDDEQGGDQGSGEDEGTRVVEGIGGDPTDAALNDARQDSGQAASEADSSFADQQEDGAEEEDAQEEEQEDQDEQTEEQLPETGKKYSVYQMMSSSEDDFDIEHENPLSPFMLPAACALAVASGTTTAAKQSKEQGRPWNVKGKVKALLGRLGLRKM